MLYVLKAFCFRSFQTKAQLFLNKIMTFLQEHRPSIIVWVLGLISSMAFEALATTYSNILRDHVNKVQFYLTVSPNILKYSL